MDGQVCGLGTVHPLLTLGFLGTWNLPLHLVFLFPLILCTKPIGDGGMDDRGRFRIELAVSSSCSVCWRPWSDGRRVMGMQQHPSSAAIRESEQPFSDPHSSPPLEEGPRKCGTIITRSSFPGWPTAATELLHMRPKKIQVNSSIKQRPLVVASRNVRTLQDTGLGIRRRTALIACELARYNIDIVALNETRLPNEGSLVRIGTGYIFFLRGLPKDARRIHGVGFTVWTAIWQSTQESPIAMDERLMTLRFPLAKDHCPAFVSIYAPTLDSSDDLKDRFYDTLYSTLKRI